MDTTVLDGVVEDLRIHYAILQSHALTADMGLKNRVVDVVFDMPLQVIYCAREAYA